MGWKVIITAITFDNSPDQGNDQVISISYRKGGTTNAFILYASLTVDDSGAIISTPNPFSLSGIDDSWDSIEIQAVNDCNTILFYQTFNKP